MALQIAPLIVLERRILIFLYLFMAGIILFHLMAMIWHGRNYLNWLLLGSLLAMIAGLAAASAGHDRFRFRFSHLFSTKETSLVIAMKDAMQAAIVP